MKRLSSYERLLKDALFDWKTWMEFYAKTDSRDCRWLCVHDLEKWAISPPPPLLVA
jgi:hypothetical protein